MNCTEFLKQFLAENNINESYMEYVSGRINQFDEANEDKADIKYEREVIMSVIVDSFKLNSENLKDITNYCVKKNLQLGRRHKKILLSYLNYRKQSDLDAFFKELKVENKNFDDEDINTVIASKEQISDSAATENFNKLWNLAVEENDKKKLSDYLFGLYSKLHAYYNNYSMSKKELFKYNLQFIGDDLNKESIEELRKFCDEESEDTFYDKYIMLLRTELQEKSLKGKVESAMNQLGKDDTFKNSNMIFDRIGDTHYLDTEEYDSVYFRVNQEVYSRFETNEQFFDYVMDTVAQAYRVLVNNKVFGVEIDNIYDGDRNLKWLLYSYIGIYAERFIRTEEKRKFYSGDKIAKEMFNAYGISYKMDLEAEVLNALKKIYNSKKLEQVEKCINDLFSKVQTEMTLEAFKDFLDEWRFVYYGFSFNDCYVIRGTKDEHLQLDGSLHNDNKLLLIFYKYRMDERKIPCPVCSGLNVCGNSYPEVGHRSWECKNVICKSRSKSNRGKRYSFKTNYMQKGTLNLDSENIITKEMISKWRKDIVSTNSDKETYSMFIKYFSFPDENVLFINGDESVLDYLNGISRNITNMSIMGSENWVMTSNEKLDIEKDIFRNYFEKGEYVDRFIREKQHVNVGDKVVVDEQCDAYIINGDSFEALKKIEAGSVAAAVTSPPYFNAREYSQWENMYLYYIDMYNIAKNTLETLDESGIFLYNIGDINGNEMTIAKSNMGTKRLLLGAYSILAFEKAGYELVDNFIWNKGEPQSKRSTNDGNFTPHYQKPVNCYEHMFIFKRKGDDLKINNNSIPDSWKSYIADFSPVIKINCNGENTVGHTAPYPEDIPNFAASVFGKPGKYILDPFLGSGTSIVSAVRNGYKGIGIEFSKEYAELAKKKFEEGLPDKRVELI